MPLHMVVHSLAWKATINCCERLLWLADVRSQQRSHAGSEIEFGACREVEALRLKESPPGEYEVQQLRPKYRHGPAEALDTPLYLGLRP